MKEDISKRQTLAFQSTLTRISDEREYFALPVPEKISRALGTKAAVPVSARLNGLTPFLVSLHPVGGGRHSMRVKASVRKEARVGEGDRVKVEITVIDRAAVAIPADLLKALRDAGVEKAFKAVPAGRRNYTIRVIDEAAKPETRARRIQAVVTELRSRGAD